jgi:hypothetical protein
VTSPNDPGYPPAGDPANGNGPRPPQSSSGSVPDPAEVPPWQRGRSRRQTARRTSAAPDLPGAEAKTTRLSGSTAPQEPIDSDGAVPSRTEAYQSELPDLSGPTPRPPSPRKPLTERTSGDAPAPRASAASRLQIGSRARAGAVRASMQIRRVDPWSVLKVSLVLSVCLFFVWMIAVAFLYLVLGAMGVWSKLNSNVGDLLTAQGGGSEIVSSGAIFGGAALIGLVNIVLLTAMATIGAFIYNLTTDVVGGVEVTLADRD